ncbi:unnamed protein product [Dovyalis caffra]|uniref:Transducin/WD40 repeat-like superfamily protein n=1 Tax=Dovyalis caffra TaxID=77055 RepID=A0AAV1RL55_9ROSI|nr:unnamed protein product [Dovyalis caffra]
MESSLRISDNHKLLLSAVTHRLLLPYFSSQFLCPNKTYSQKQQDSSLFLENMPQELPGFYYDEEKNRYFPLRSPIPGSSRSSSSTNNAQKPSITNTQASNICRRTGVRIAKLLQGRELNGNVITSNKGKCDFREEFLKIQASQPLVWKYQTTERIADSALDQIHIDIHTPEGQTGADCLITGGVNGSLSLFEVGKVGEHNQGVKCIPDQVWPIIEENRAECSKGPGRNLTSLFGLGVFSLSLQIFYHSKSISCPRNLNVIRYRDLPGIATLGSETSGGSVYILNVVEPVDFDSSYAIGGMMRKAASFNCTIWTADCSPNSSRAVIGKSALVNLETGMASWVCRSGSDVLSQQLDPSENVVLCGLRNGAILTVDVRKKQGRVSDRFIRHRIPYSSVGRQGPSSSKQWFQRSKWSKETYTLLFGITSVLRPVLLGQLYGWIG